MPNKSQKPKYSIITITRNSYPIFNFIMDLCTAINTTNLVNYIIVDNASNDEFKKSLKSLIVNVNKNYSLNITLIENTKNRLFSAANNQGIEKILALGNNPDWIFLVNPDIEVPKTDKILCMKNKVQYQIFDDCIYHALFQNAGIFGIKLLFENGTIEHAGGMDNSHRGFKKPRITREFDTPMAVEWVTGAFMGISMETISKIGLLDDKTYPHWVSDQEYCRRAQLFDIHTWYYPLEMIHQQGSSTETSPHEECWKDLPDLVKPNVTPTTVEHIKETAQKNADELKSLERSTSPLLIKMYKNSLNLIWPY